MAAHLGDFDASERWCSMALPLLDAVSDRAFLSDAYLERAGAREARGDSTGALADYDAALPLFDGEHARWEHARALVARADLLRSRLERDGGLADYRRVERICAELGKDREEPRILVRRGEVQVKQGAFSEAEETLGRSIAMLDASQDPLSAADARMWRARARKRSDRPAGALEDMDAAVRLLRDVDSHQARLHLAMALEDRGAFRHQRGDAAFAETMAPLLEPGRSEGWVSLTRRLISAFRWRREHLETAGEDFTQALALYRFEGNLLGQANVLSRLADVRRDQGDLAGSCAHIDEALNLYRQVRSKLGEARALWSRGNIHQLRGDLATARRDLDAALVLYESLGARVSQAAVLVGLGKLERWAGRWELALAHLSAAQQLFEAGQDASNASEALAWTAIVHFLAGDAARAAQRAREARERATNSGNRSAWLLGSYVLFMIESDMSPRLARFLDQVARHILTHSAFRRLFAGKIG